MKMGNRCNIVSLLIILVLLIEHPASANSQTTSGAVSLISVMGTVAGNGSLGSSGDGDPATDATFSSITFVADK